MLEQWFSLFGGKERYDRNPDARIRVYIDGDNATGPSLDFQLYFAHTVGVESCTNDHCADPRVPWASKDVQHMAHGGALLNRCKCRASTRRSPGTRVIIIIIDLGTLLFVSSSNVLCPPPSSPPMHACLVLSPARRLAHAPMLSCGHTFYT